MNELIIEIIKLAMEKSTTTKNTIKIEYDTIVNKFEINLFRNGYKNSFYKKDYKKDEYYNEYVYLDDKDDKDVKNKLSNILNYLKRLES